MDKRSYNILNFLKEQQIIMQFTSISIDAKSKTRKSKKNILTHVRIAKNWEPKIADAVDAFAKSYKNSNDGLMQVHKSFNNVFINQDGKIQINKQTLPYNILP